MVIGRTLEGNQRGAVVAHDSDSVFVLINKEGAYSFPSHPLEIGSDARVAAEKGFDMFAGNALRKAPGVSAFSQSLLLAPVAGAIIRPAIEEMVAISQHHLGHRNNTTFFSCLFPSIADHRLTFHSARRPDNGFELTAKQAERFKGADVVPIEIALQALEERDRAALCDALRLRSPVRALLTVNAQCVSLQLFVRPADDSNLVALAQHSDDTSAEWVDEAYEQITGPSAPARQAQHSETTHFDSPECQPMGVDPEVDALLEAAATVYYSRLVEGDSQASSEGASAWCHVGSAEYAGTPSKVGLPTREELVAAQLAHPGTAQHIEHVRFRDTGISDPSARDDPAFVEESSHLTLDTNGLLVRSGAHPGDAPRIVLPPSLHHAVLCEFHDRNGHLGVQKVLPHICRRFYWGNHTVMRKTVADHIRQCEVCRRVKLPHHHTGEYQMDGVGSCPNDLLAVDHFSVGACCGAFMPHQH